jgi:hypothetical protein
MLVPILFLVFCFILPFIVLNLSNRNNPYVKKRKWNMEIDEFKGVNLLMNGESCNGICNT